MQHTIDRPRDERAGGRIAPRGGGRRRSGAVMLVTFDSAPFHPGAVRFAVESAVESARALLVVNAVEFPTGGRLTPVALPSDPPAVAAALQAPAELAHALGGRVERVRVLSPRPAAGLLELVADRRPALVAFGPNPAALRRLRRPTWRRARQLLAALERDAGCLLWSAQAPVAGAVSSSARPSSRARPAPIRRAGPGRITTIATPTSNQIPTRTGTGRRGTPRP